MTLATDVVIGSILTVSGVPSIVTAINGSTITTTPAPAAPGAGTVGQVLTALGTAQGADFEANAASGNTTSGTLTTGTVPKASGAHAIANSAIVEGAALITLSKLLSITGATPASAAAAGVAGTIAWDTGFIYICSATNTWLRVAIATW